MKKILIASLKAGAGHFKAAQGLEKAFKIQHPEIEVKNIDLLDYSSYLMKQFYGKSYLETVRNLPEVYAYLYKNYKGIESATIPRLIFDRLNAPQFLKIYEEFNPEAVIGTHFICGAMFADYNQMHKRACPVFMTVTDYEIHPLWVVKIGEIEKYFVAHGEMKNNLEMLGVAEGKISITGIPIDPAFCEPKDRAALCQKYGLDGQLPAVLFVGGSFGTTAVDEVIGRIKLIKKDFQIVIVCGKNTELYQKICALKAIEPRIKLVFEFVDFIDELMAISDIMVSKPGGITVSESLAMALPMIMVEPIPGQEEANVDYLLENGAGLKARSVSSLIFKLNDVLENPEKAERLKTNIQKISKPRASFEIAKEVVDSINSYEA